jgi:hypothetical protein
LVAGAEEGTAAKLQSELLLHNVIATLVLAGVTFSPIMIGAGYAKRFAYSRNCRISPRVLNSAGETRIIVPSSRKLT